MRTYCFASSCHYVCVPPSPFPIPSPLNQIPRVWLSKWAHFKLQNDAELSALSIVDHPGIIKLLDVVYGPGCQCLILEFAPKGTLLDHVRSRKRLPEREAAAIFASVADALLHCHSRQVTLSTHERYTTSGGYQNTSPEQVITHF